MGLFGRDDPPQTAPQPASGEAARPHQSQADRHASRTVITDSIQIEGALSGAGGITVDGTVRGSIDGKDDVMIASRGRVDAAVHGRTVIVAGRVVGNITADQKIELEPTAEVEGDMTSPRILIKDGATFRGKVNMKPPAPRPEVTTSSARKPDTKPDRS